MDIEQILKSNDPRKLKELFSFTLEENSDEEIILKFNLWARYFMPKYFTSADAGFHNEIDSNNLKVYRGTVATFVNIAFRGAGKTARTKLWRGFVLLNDIDHYRKYLKVLCEDIDNAKQIVTDIYNMLVNPRIHKLYPEVFEKTVTKREERMESFTSATGVKITAGTVGTNQRGALQEESRSDEIWFEDFESRTTLRSARKTRTVFENMEEARTGLSKNGSCIYTCNYISEQGNVHTLVEKASPRNIVLIIPIEDAEGEPTWERYSKGDIAQMRLDDEDFEGERLCKPSASKDVFFDRESLERMEKRTPIKIVAGFKIFREYNPSHRFASGHDVAGGVGLDSCTSVFIDFDVIPAQVVATFKSNTIRPDVFGDEIQRESDIFGSCLSAPESNNHGHATIARAKQLEVNMYSTKAKETKVANQQLSVAVKEYGWHTNALTKPKMLFAFGKAIVDGHISLNDPDLIKEAMMYTRNDLMDKEEDARLSTRHFDLLIAACIAWQMKDYAEVEPEKDKEAEEREELLHPEIGM